MGLKHGQSCAHASDSLYRRRPSSGIAHPRGGDDPYLSSNNEHILDIKFGERPASLLRNGLCQL